MPVRVLVVDDSPTMRAIISGLLRRDPEIEVIGTACDARQARVMIREMNPDVVTLDIEMPGMNGLEFLEKIMRLRPMPVVIISSLTRSGCETTMLALELGAADCFAKPDGSVSLLNEEHGRELAAVVRQAAAARCQGGQVSAPPRQLASQLCFPNDNPAHLRLIAIGASTGGVEALHQLLPAFPPNCPPILIVQHISAAFAPAMAERLDQKCDVRVQLAETGVPLRPGHAYIAPGNDRHMLLASSSTLTVKLVPGDPVSGHRPSVDALFSSVARHLGAAATGILLTGMGADGARGLLDMRRAGARTIAQDEASCIVYGMPRAAVELGAAQKVLPLSRIAERALAQAG